MKYYLSIPVTLLTIYTHYMLYFFAPVDTGYIFYFCYTAMVNFVITTFLLTQVPLLSEEILVTKKSKEN